MEGAIYSDNDKLVYTFEGKWNDSITLTECASGDQEVVWQKKPYPESWQHMYGMTYHGLQMNHLSKSLKLEIPHTDSRMRPDQRALEHGKFALASKEKNRLEEKQRAVRKYMEKNGIQHQPKYFEVWSDPPSVGNPNVKHSVKDPVQFKYNGLYFEKDRKNRDWSRLPDLFTDKLPEGMDKNQYEGVPEGEEDEKHHEYDADEHAKLTAGN